MSKGIRQWINDQLAMLQQIASIASLGLLMITMSASIFDLVAWHGIPSYFGIPAILGVTILGVWAFAWYYTHALKMYRYNRYAQMKLNPFEVEEINPMNCLLQAVIHIPDLEAQVTILKNQKLQGLPVEDAQIEKLEQSIARLRHWQTDGHIPISDYPPEVVERFNLNGRHDPSDNRQRQR